MKAILSAQVIQQYETTLLASSLFYGFDEKELEEYLSLAPVIIKTYKKNDFIALAGDDMEGIGVMLEGSALLTRENVMGQRNIMTDLSVSDMFGEALLFSKKPLWPATIVAKKPCKIMFIPLDTFMATLPRCHQCQTKLLSNLLEDLSEKTLTLTRKVHYLTLKGMRERIFAYLTDMYMRQKSATLRIPHTRQEMADILNVSRTALSRELSRLDKEGIISISGKSITINDLNQVSEFGFTNN